MRPLTYCGRSYTAQTWRGEEHITPDIEGLSIDGARSICQVHASLGYIGRVVPESTDGEDWEVYLPDGTVRVGTFGEVTVVKGFLGVTQ